MSYHYVVMKCTLCPRECNVDRKRNKGFCNTDGIVVSRIGVHEWEEPCISGNKGSGTIFSQAVICIAAFVKTTIFPSFRAERKCPPNVLRM